MHRQLAFRITLPRTGVLACALLVSLAGCDNSTSPDDPTKRLYKGVVAASLTDDSLVAAVAAHLDGSSIAVLRRGPGERGAGAIAGAVVTAPDGSTLAVWIGSDGLPTHAVVAGVTVLFSNYSTSTVDLGLIAPTGEIEIHRQVRVDSSLLRTARIANLQLSNLQTAAGGEPLENLAALLGATGTFLSIASCPISTVAAVSTGGVAVYLAGVTCGLALVELFELVLPTDDAALVASIEGVGALSNAIGCAGRQWIECAGIIVDVARFAVYTAQTVMENAAEEIDLVNGALRSGSGDVQITLTWDNHSDVDLWVTDPMGERIFWNHPFSASGGALDVDDRDGFGPENIFWPRLGAPTGTYIVQVHHYAGVTNTNFQVLVQAFGQAKAYSGILTPRGLAHVATFRSDQVLPLVASQNDDCTACSRLPAITSFNLKPVER